MTPSLPAYLYRIGYTGATEPTLEVLRAVHRQHLLSIPYENLDIHLGRTLSLGLDAIYDKLVVRKRGGWCYEMNGLLAWALREMGFDVTLLGGTVGRDALGALAEGNHLVLLVKLDQPYIADAGFGNGLLEPLPLVTGEHAQRGFVFRLSQDNPPPAPPNGRGDGSTPLPLGRETSLWEVGGGQNSRWHFHNHKHGGVGFDFTLAPHSMSDFSARCTWLQTAPESGFVRVAVCHRWRDDGIHSLRGAVLRHTTPTGMVDRVIDTQADYRHTLRQVFDLDLSDADIDQLWPTVWQSHLAWVAQS
jgi:N-hydroxyarylamine O-acetyltransferase